MDFFEHLITWKNAQDGIKWKEQESRFNPKSLNTFKKSNYISCSSFLYMDVTDIL